MTSIWPVPTKTLKAPKIKAAVSVAPALPIPA